MENDLILSLETATRGGSLALLRGESLIASSTGIADESHSINLLSRIESLLDEAHVTLRDVDLFAVASGPGSFTGLRIGLATMKAFAAVFNRPCIGVPTLEAIAFAAGASECTYALLPAGRGEVFAQSWERGHLARSLDGEHLRELKERARCPRSQAEHIPPHVLLERISELKSIRWAGPGAHLYKGLLRERAAALGIEFVEEQVNYHLTLDDGSSAGDQNEIQWTLAPNEEHLAGFVGRLALHRLSDNKDHRAEDLRAIYVRPSDAELHK